MAKPHYISSFKGGEGGSKGVKGVVVQFKKANLGTFQFWVCPKSGYVSSIEQKGEIEVAPSRTKGTFTQPWRFVIYFKSYFNGTDQQMEEGQ